MNNILQHPYFRKMYGDASLEISQQILTGNMHMIDKEFFHGEVEEMIFRPLEDAAALLAYLRRIFLHLLELIAVRAYQNENILDREFVSSF